MTFKSELFLDIAGFVGELKLLLVSRKSRKLLNLIAFETVARVLVEIEKESSLKAIHFDFFQFFF